MIWYILLSFLLAVFLWILIGPVCISINTDDNLYHLDLPPLFSAMVIQTDELFHIKVRIFFIPFKFDPFRIKTRKKRKTSIKKTEKAPRKKRSGNPFRNMEMIKNLLGSIQIRELQLDIDTDDFLLNAWLIPVFSAVNQNNIQLQTNYTGSISLVLEMRTRIAAILWVLIKNKYNSLY